MKRFLCIFLLGILFVPVLDAQDRISSKLDEYLKAVDTLPLAEAQAELDFMISSVMDDSLRSNVATAAYRHFRESKLMTSDNLAVYLYDKWFEPCDALLPTIDEFEEASLHAYVNRNSLIGSKACSLTMEDIAGEEKSLPQNGRYDVIFFFSATCPKCLYTAGQLCDYFARKGVYAKLKRKRLKINVYTVYTGDDLQEWESYVHKHFGFVKRCGLKVYHLKAGEADIVSDYGVIQTPRLFLVDRENVIIGRNLDVPALSKLLK